jgi:hypothetical protein
LSPMEIAEAERQAARWLEENGKGFTKRFPVAKVGNNLASGDR